MIIATPAPSVPRHRASRIRSSPCRSASKMRISVPTLRDTLDWVTRRGFIQAAVAGVAFLSIVAVCAPTTSFGSTTPVCSTSNLRLDLIRTLGAAGARDWDFTLRNVGSHTCHPKGYPRVALLDSSARALHVTVGRVRGPARAVVLGLWQRSFFTFHFESNGPCPAGIFPTGLRVVPPHDAQGLRIYRHVWRVRG